METLNLSVNSSIFDDTQLYKAYKDAGPSFLLISTAVLLNIFSVPGICLNFAIIYVTLKYRSLRSSSSSFLIALTALFESIHALGHLLFLWVTLSGTNFIPFALCFKFLFVPFTCTMASFASIALTGLDRLVQLAFPKLNLSHPLCLFAYFTVSLGSGAFASWIYYVHSFQVPENWPQTGFIGDILPIELGYFHLVYMLGYNLLAISFYIGIWILLRLKTTSANIHAHILKSMVIIISINIGGYFVNVTVRLFVIPQLQLDQIHTWLIQTYLGILLNVCVAMNAVVLYFCSTEYRTCFKAELHNIFFRNRVQTMKNSSAVVSTIKHNTLIGK